MTHLRVPELGSRLDDKVVAVVGGGPGPERVGSLASARDVEGAFQELQIQSEFIDLANIRSASFEDIDIAFLVTHGIWGEDGRAQGYLETLGIPHTGPSVVGCALSMDKILTNIIAAEAGAAVPVTRRLDAAFSLSSVAEIISELGPDIIVRPSDGGGSIGIVRTTDPRVIVHHMRVHSLTFRDFLVSPFVRGLEVSIGMAMTSDGLEFLPTLSTTHNGDYYSYEIKHDERLRQHTCPANLGEKVVNRIREVCARIYNAMQLSGFVRVDFIVDDSGRPWFLEVNALPGMSRSGNLAMMARAAGYTYNDLVLKQTLLGLPSEMRRPHRITTSRAN